MINRYRNMKRLLKLASLMLASAGFLAAQQSTTALLNQEIKLESSWLDSFKFRNIGPAFMSGRIADIAIDPQNENTWYVAVGSGGVWKTVNAGTTFEPVFDDYDVYSTGCITVDPHNSNRVWLGTGENVGGRHVSFGDGIYLSEDAGKSWTNMGLQKTEHISEIIVHPENSQVIFVAAQGPLWNKGEQRGFYKSVDGGKRWYKTLGDGQWIGVTDIAIDPLNPDRLYAATWERHRTVAAVVDGGEETRIYRSDDGGESWVKLEKGLPEGKWGKTGIAISPQQPDVIYAAIELNRRTGGVWKSVDRGASWTKMSNTVSGATGPHYYQELYACPHKFDRLYLMNTSLLKSEDGGKSFSEVNSFGKHVDNHSINFKADDPDYLIVGTDGGVYETFDHGKTWRFMNNIPVTQYYKLAVDDSEPFYKIYGGTQDNSTQGGPSRTDNLHGIRNSDWQIVLNWDGHQPATEPGNPNIIYAERQEGHLARVDVKTGEVIDIQPQAGPGEAYERFNWDAPILVSPHNPQTIYFASQRVWKSENRGDSWEAISDDLTRNQERLNLPIMGRRQSWDSPWDIYAMSNYNTITSLSESPKKKGMIYAGTDDGLLQLTENGGKSWRRIPVDSLGVPGTAFINDVKADLFDEKTVYVALDNHKYGDYTPYLVKSTDKGKTWMRITNGIPDKHLVWRIVQDHINPRLLFLGTEFGLFVSLDGGFNWTEMNGGMPTISLRDLVIQKREDDLVAASFGRGFFVLDDYSALRMLSQLMLERESVLFEPRKGYWYIERPVIDFDDRPGSLGSQLYLADNPPFGVNFTYYLKDAYKSRKELRQEKEKDVQGNIDFPGWNRLEIEERQTLPYVFVEIKDMEGNIVRRVRATNKAGFHRVNWDLRVASRRPISEADRVNAVAMMAAPGSYKAQLYKYVSGEVAPISDEISFETVPLYQGSLAGIPKAEVAQFWRDYERIETEVTLFELRLNEALNNYDQLWTAIHRSNVDVNMLELLLKAKPMLSRVDMYWNGYKTKNQVGEKNAPNVKLWLSAIQRGIERSTYGPTDTHRQMVGWIQSALQEKNNELDAAVLEMDTVYGLMKEAGGPVIKGLEK